MRHSNPIARLVIAGALILGPAVATAQTLNDPSRTEMDRADRERDADRGMGSGWLGLLGLGGLAGLLKGRPKTTATYTAEPNTAASRI